MITNYDYEQYEAPYDKDYYSLVDGPELTEIENECRVCGKFWVTNYSEPPCPICESRDVRRHRIIG